MLIESASEHESNRLNNSSESTEKYVISENMSKQVKAALEFLNSHSQLNVKYDPTIPEDDDFADDSENFDDEEFDIDDSEDDDSFEEDNSIVDDNLEDNSEIENDLNSIF